MVAIAGPETGALVMPALKSGSGGHFSFSGDESDARLLFHLAYFDRVIVVGFNPTVVPYRFATPLEQHLIATGKIGMLSRQRLIFEEPNPEYFVGQFAIPLYTATNDQSPGMWALAPTAQVAEALSQTGKTVATIELHKCLPAPRPDIPADEIISFRLSHTAELNELHDEIAKLKATIVNTNGANFDLAKRDLERSVERVRQAFEAAKFKFGLSSLEVSVGLPDAVTGAVGSFIAARFGIDPNVGAVAGTMLSVALRKTRLPVEKNWTPPAFMFVAKGLKEGILEQSPDWDENRFLDNYQDCVLQGINVPSFYPQDMAPLPFVKNSMVSHIIST